MQKDVIFSEDKGMLTAHIQCDVDHHTAKPMREKIDRRLFELKPHTLVIDFSKVEFMDSSGLGLILGRVEKATALNAEVRLIGASPRIMKLISLAGIERVRHLSVVK
jgi:stage II sporulation protein AA (anti-sigma F factor antagonist)